MEGERIGGDEIPADTRALAELLAARPDIDLAEGRCTLELLFTDGRLTEAFTKRRIPATALEQDAAR